ncbi:hypothetical protein HPB47_012252 [Ixodes persulcatus]|uniref:Uncharacterized protein n=1 Tax=Ixodes persulcatus TaxID=34615 RepID=A0AC60NU38_IXOPE|nr:hypothetical protein HPB47_012252 [Ixodes persulcatus]
MGKKSKHLHNRYRFSIPLTADFWTSIANDAYLGITAHWIDDDWMLRSATLQSLKCAAHTLQLCIHKALNVTGVERLLAACRRTVGHFKHSSSNQAVLSKHAAELGAPKKKLQQDIATRWNSTYIMITSLLEMKEPLRRSMEDSSTIRSSIPRLTDVDWDMLEQLREALKPLLDITELLGGDKYVTRSVISALKQLKNKMKTNGCDPAFICRFKAMLVDSIDERLRAWPRYYDYELATCLDPRFKSLACIEKDRRELVWERLSQLTRASSDDSTDLASKKKRKYVFSEENEEPTISCQVSLYRSMAEVTDDELDPLQWWRAQGSLFPQIVPIVKSVMYVPVTSTPCERLFSAAGMIVNKQRNSLLPENFNKLLCLRSWGCDL